jgi:hypothetical protein
MDRRTFLSLTGAAAGAALAAPQPAEAKAKTRWKNGKKWVYSITYDEGCEELLKYTAPIHREFGIPGHVALVSAQLGVKRDVPGSSYHDFMILSPKQMRGLIDEGWGASSHSMTHVGVTWENSDVEVIEARKVLADALGHDIPIFTVPGSNHGHPPSIEAAPKAGYDAIMTIYDWVNTKSTDLLWLGRCPLHTEYPGPFYSAFDPYKRLQQAESVGGWIIDYCHNPRPDTPIHPAKDCTTQELRARFEAVKEIGGDDVWLADPNEVVEFLKTDPEAVKLRAENAQGLNMLHNEEMRKLYDVS